VSATTDHADTLAPLARPTLVQAALCSTTERLAAELIAPASSPPEWSEFEWRAARAVAAMHGISGLLAGRLRWQGAPGWQEFLFTQREHIARRHARLQNLLGQIDQELRRRQVPGVALKGAALHAEGFYEAGDRPMGDIDLLVDPAHAELVAHVLVGLGFRCSSRTFKQDVFVAQHETPPRPFGEHADNDMKVELHTRIVEALPLRLAGISQHELMRDARPGLNPYGSRVAFVAHLLLHAAGAMVFRSLRLIQLHDIALLGTRATQRDWQEMLTWDPWWALPPLILAERYYGPIVPRAVLASLHKCCPPALRWVSSRRVLSDVSLSHLWVSVFPGLEWARTPLEALRYTAGRVVPSARVRSERRSQLDTEPSLAEGDWARLSQGRRILRFLTSRTPQPWTMHNVRAALAQRP